MMYPLIDILHLDFRVDLSRYLGFNSRFIVTRPFCALYWVIALNASCDPDSRWARLYQRGPPRD